MTAEPLRVCGQCGMRVYRNRPCNYVGLLHPRPLGSLPELVAEMRRTP